MKRLFLTKAAFLTLLISALSACTGQFDQMNVDPNNPTTISPQFLLPTVIEKSVDRYWGGRARFERLNLDGAMLWMQYLARNIYSNEGDNYGVSPAFYDNNWASLYNESLLNAQRIVALSGKDGALPNTNYEGVALVLRSWVFSLITDTWGAVPYSEALQGTAETPVYKPAYDTQEKVYEGLLADLKLANEKLVAGGPPIAGDILYNGNILAWKKFANSLRLRLANRQAAKKAAASRAIMAEILADPATYPIFTANTDNAVLRHTATLPSNNEWHQVMIQDGRTDWNISQTLIDRLQQLGDLRTTVFADTIRNGSFRGVPNGLPDAIATSFLGNASVLSSNFTKADAPSTIMTYAEVQFILAEAALDGDINGSANTFFGNGVKASFEQFNDSYILKRRDKDGKVVFDTTSKPWKPMIDRSVTTSYIQAYIARLGEPTKEKVMEQKWIALFGQAMEAWAEYRRTGLPELPARDPRSSFENDGVLPTRLKYPTSEEALNKEKMTQGATLNGGPNDFKTKLWWAEK